MVRKQNKGKDFLKKMELLGMRQNATKYQEAVNIWKLISAGHICCKEDIIEAERQEQQK